MLVGSTENNKKDFLRGYETDPMFESAQAFLDVAQAARQESGIDIMDTPTKFMQNSMTRDELKKYFVEDSYDPKDPKYNNHPQAVNEHLENMEQLFDNDCNALMQESANLGFYSPVIGMALPVHKNILMNAIFDQVMPKDVARSPKFTLTMETRTLVDTKGNEYDMFYEQNRIKPAVDESIPSFEKVITTLPEQETIDFIQEAKKATGIDFNTKLAHLSMKSNIKGIILGNVYVAPGQYYWDATTQKEVVADDKTKGVHSVLFRLNARFTPGYGDNNRQLNHRFHIAYAKADDGVIHEASGTLMGYLNEKDRMYLAIGPLKLIGANADGTDKFDSANELPVQGLIVEAILDVSSAIFPTVKVKWSTKTDFFEIPEAPHVTIPISPEEVKDIQALYDVNQVTKLMSMMRLVLLHWKDDSILEDLNQSFLTMPESDKVTFAFDWAPPLNFAGTPTEWREAEFFNRIDMAVTQMLQVLNDENMTVLVIGRPDLIRRLVPTQVSYTTPSNIGPVELDFKRTVVTSEKRVYNFISSQKLRNNNNLIMLLIPRNSMRITYKVIDYQMYLSNEIRDTEQYQLPSMTAFERWLFLQYQPVQGRMQIMNPTGLRENVKAKDYIGVNAMNDYTANDETYASQVNGVIDKETGNFKIPPVITD